MFSLDSRRRSPVFVCGTARGAYGEAVEVLPFLGVALVVVVTPGVDMALVTRNAIVRGRRAGLATALGVNVGIAFWSVAAALGLAALVAASAEAFTVVKLAGASLPRLARRPGAALPRDRARRRRTRNAAVPPGARQQPAQPEDRDLLHRPSAAVRRSRRGRGGAPPPRRALQRAGGGVALRLRARRLARQGRSLAAGRSPGDRRRRRRGADRARRAARARAALAPLSC